MTNNKLKFIVAGIVVLPLLALSGYALASQVTGTLTTGISGNNGNVVNGIVVVPPMASPAAGTYNSAQSVTLTADGSLSIHYTTDGSVPSCSTGTVYSGAVSVSVSEVITAISCYADNHSSTAAVFGYAVVPVSSGGGGGGGSNTPAASPSTSKVGDINNDKNVDEYDFALLMSNWGVTGTSVQGDLNNDKVVDEYDFALLMANWGN